MPNRVSCMYSPSYAHLHVKYHGFFNCCSHLFDLRIHKLYTLVSANNVVPSARGVVPDPVRVKLEAWYCKSFCVLVKRKCSRGQVSRSAVFRQLMSALTGKDGGFECLTKSDASYTHTTPQVT